MHVYPILKLQPFIIMFLNDSIQLNTVKKSIKEKCCKKHLEEGKKKIKTALIYQLNVFILILLHFLFYKNKNVN
ncbi:hypothetical protein Lupro_07950 [Lutibacter profundi]|uniref:Transmembrane protein n=1 Tax=Lutibacter profundi TaxID=1622118 RepID=A0A0X8G6W3_9FLAO|nr:hypothetical protein Lupro_07950 [Lutibacter profundi]